MSDEIMLNHEELIDEMEDTIVSEFSIHEHLYDGLDMLAKRLENIESILEQYLKPNTREDMDSLEQRFKCIELLLRKFANHIVEDFPRVTVRLEKLEGMLGPYTKLKEDLDKGQETYMELLANAIE